MDIYISPHKKTTITKKRAIQLKDIAEVSAPGSTQGKVGNIIVFKVTEDIKSNYIINIITIIESILAKYPDATISNEGAEDVVLQYLPEDFKESKFVTFFKIFIICLMLFAGSWITIMAYHEDVNLVEVFIKLQEVITGIKSDNVNWISIPYSLGIGLGIIVFYNQLGVYKLTDDPTPIEVEMTKYDADIDSCLVDTSNRSPMKGNKHNDN